MRIEVCVRERDNKQITPSINVTLAPDSLIGTMRKELADYLRWPKERLKFVYKEKPLWAEAYDELSVREARIHSKTNMPPVLVVYKMAESDMSVGKPADSAEMKSDHLYPRFVLANERDYFDLLFDVLSIGGELSQKVWRLITKLPRNEILTRSILTFSLRVPAPAPTSAAAAPAAAAAPTPAAPAAAAAPADGKTAPAATPNAPAPAPAPASSAVVAAAATVPDWNRLLDSSSILRLLYALQIVDSNAAARETDSEARKLEVNEWCEVFLTQGGFQHLYNIIMKLQVAQVFTDILPQQVPSG
jgi:hypothetical protein